MKRNTKKIKNIYIKPFVE